MKLFFREIGNNGSPIIILHGLFGASENWLSIGRALAEEHRVFLLDQRNHGRSPHSAEMNYGLMAEDVNEFMQDHGLRRASLIGHSMGGKVAMSFARTYPWKVAKLIVVDIAPRPADPAFFRNIVDILQKLDLPLLHSRKDADEALKADIAEQSLRNFLLKNLKRVKGKQLAWKVNLDAIGEHIETIAGAVPGLQSGVDVPALFLTGENSDYIRREDHEKIRELFAQAEIDTIPGAGHWIHADAPEALLKRLGQFLKD